MRDSFSSRQITMRRERGTLCGLINYHQKCMCLVNYCYIRPEAGIKRLSSGDESLSDDVLFPPEAFLTSLAFKARIVSRAMTTIDLAVELFKKVSFGDMQTSFIASS